MRAFGGDEIVVGRIRRNGVSEPFQHSSDDNAETWQRHRAQGFYTRHDGVRQSRELGAAQLGGPAGKSGIEHNIVHRSRLTLRAPPVNVAPLTLHG